MSVIEKLTPYGLECLENSKGEMRVYKRRRVSKIQLSAFAEDRVQRLKNEMLSRKYGNQCVHTYLLAMRKIFEFCGDNPTMAAMEQMSLVNSPAHFSLLKCVFSKYCEYILGVYIYFGDRDVTPLLIKSKASGYAKCQPSV